MCRWNAYFGQPVLIDELLFRTQHSLIEQSLHSRMGVDTTNGDGFGLGWYRDSDRGSPGRYRSVTPAWSDTNLRDLASHVESPLFLAHVRATTGTAVQQTNCHPFRHGRWLWMHNGVLTDFLTVKRDLLLAVDPELFPEIEGSTDSEVFFFLALTLGLEGDPPGAVARAVGLIEEIGRRHGVDFPIQMTVATTDGETTWAFRYSSEGRSRSLFHSTDVAVMRQQYPDNPVLHELSDDTRLVVSEPLGSLRGAWREVPESTCVVVRAGHVELLPFVPLAPHSVG